MKIHQTTIALTALALGGSLYGAGVTVPNHSFEDPVLAEGSFAGGDPTGWISTSSVNFGTENHNSGVYGGSDASDGNNVYWNNVGSGGGNTATLTSTVPLGALAEGDYTLTIDFLFRTDSVSGDAMPNTEFGLALASAPATILGTAGTATDALDVGGAGGIVTRTYTLNVPNGDANIGSNYVIRLNSSQSGSGWDQLAVDNVQLDFVPEPSAALLGLGGFLLVLRRRR